MTILFTVVLVRLPKWDAEMRWYLLCAAGSAVFAAFGAGCYHRDYTEERARLRTHMTKQQKQELLTLSVRPPVVSMWLFSVVAAGWIITACLHPVAEDTFKQAAEQSQEIKDKLDN